MGENILVKYEERRALLTDFRWKAVRYPRLCEAFVSVLSARLVELALQFPLSTVGCKVGSSSKVAEISPCGATWGENIEM